MTVESKPRSGLNKVSYYQRMLIKAVIEHGSRKRAAEVLGMNPKTIDDVLWRAFKALKVTNISDANYLINHGVFSRKEMQSEE